MFIPHKLASVLRMILLVLFISVLMIVFACNPTATGTVQKDKKGSKNPEPTIPAWQEWLNNGQYADVIDATGTIIESGESSPGYAEARLYRGLAILAQGGDLQNAKADLDIAQNLVDQLKTLDSKQEQIMLYRGLMVVSAQLNDMATAETYRVKAIELAPEQANAISQELKSQKLIFNNVTQ